MSEKTEDIKKPRLIKPRSAAIETRYQEHLRRVKGPAKVGGK